MASKNIKQSILPTDSYKINDLEDYIHIGEVKTYPKGTLIFTPEDFGDKMAYIVSGKIKAVLEREDGKELLFYMAEQHHIIGNLFVVKSNPMRCYATEETVVCLFSKEQLIEVFQDNIEIVFEIFKNYMSKVNYFKTKLYITGFSSSTVKVYRLIQLLCRQEIPDANGRYTINLTVSQKVLAEMLDIHQVTVSKVLNYLKEEGIISKKGKKIIVHDMERLVRLIELEEKA